MIKLEPYRYELHVVVGRTAFENILKKNPDWKHEITEDMWAVVRFEPKCKGCVYGVVNSKHQDLSLLYLHEKHTDDSTILHESLHVVFNMFESRGVEVSSENQEAFCYHLEQVYAEVKKCIKKK